MITDTQSRQAKAPAISSDRWHVVHARFAPELDSKHPFTRTIVSEHDDRVLAIAAARELLTELRRDHARRKVEQKDQVFVRKPGFVSLKLAGHSEAGRS